MTHAYGVRDCALRNRVLGWVRATVPVAVPVATSHLRPVRTVSASWRVLCSCVCASRCRFACEARTASFSEVSPTSRWAACASGGPHHAVSPDVARRSCVGPLHLRPISGVVPVKELDKARNPWSLTVIGRDRLASDVYELISFLRN